MWYPLITLRENRPEVTLLKNDISEAEYALRLKKKIIPLKMESGYEADGWLGIIFGSKMFFDFGGKYPFEQKAEELVREIHRTLDNAVPSKVNVTHASDKHMPGRV